MMRICILSNNAGECGRGDADLVREDTGLLGPSVQGRSKQPILGGKNYTFLLYFTDIPPDRERTVHLKNYQRNTIQFGHTI